MEQELKQAEKKYLAHFISSLRGYYLLLVGNHRKLSDLPSHCLHSFGLSPSLSEENTASWIQSHYETLPFRDNNIDAAVIPYLLEYCDNPYQLLKELHRSLMGEGKLFLFGFERWHPWCWFNTTKPKNAFSSLQIKKLLREADFTIETTKHFHYGAIYLIAAQKHLSIITPLRPLWKKIPTFDKEWVRPAARRAG